MTHSTRPEQYGNNRPTVSSASLVDEAVRESARQKLADAIKAELDARRADQDPRPGA